MGFNEAVYGFACAAAHPFAFPGFDATVNLTPLVGYTLNEHLTWRGPGTQRQSPGLSSRTNTKPTAGGGNDRAAKSSFLNVFESIVIRWREHTRTPAASASKPDRLP